MSLNKSTLNIQCKYITKAHQSFFRQWKKVLALSSSRRGISPPSLKRNPATKPRAPNRATSPVSPVTVGSRQLATRAVRCNRFGSYPLRNGPETSRSLVTQKLVAFASGHPARDSSGRRLLLPPPRAADGRRRPATARGGRGSRSRARAGAEHSIDWIPNYAHRILHRLAGDLWGSEMDPSALVDQGRHDPRTSSASPRSAARSTRTTRCSSASTARASRSSSTGATTAEVRRGPMAAQIHLASALDCHRRQRPPPIPLSPCPLSCCSCFATPLDCSMK